MAPHPPPSQAYNWTFWRVVWATLVLVAVGLSFWLLYRFNQAIFILFVAIVMGTVIRPLVLWLQRRGLTPKAGVILVYLLLLALLTGFVLLLFPLIAEQSVTITAAVPGYSQSLREWIIDHPNQLLESLSALLPATLLPIPDTGQQTGQEMLDSAGQVLGYAGTAAKVIFTAVVILLLAAYWTLDGPKIIRSFLLLAPKDQREGISELISAMETKVGAYIAGQGILMLVVGSMALVAYSLIGLPYVLVLAVVAGVMEAVPTHWPAAGGHSGSAGGPVPGSRQTTLGHFGHCCDSAVRKQHPGAARHAQGGGRQPIRHTAGDFCSWFLAGCCRRAHGDSDSRHHSDPA